jgi:hypothetical protein
MTSPGLNLLFRPRSEIPPEASGARRALLGSLGSSVGMRRPGYSESEGQGLG